jgi:hypothetical protein
MPSPFGAPSSPHLACGLNRSRFLHTCNWYPRRAVRVVSGILKQTITCKILHRTVDSWRTRRGDPESHLRETRGEEVIEETGSRNRAEAQRRCGLQRLPSGVISGNSVGNFLLTICFLEVFIIAKLTLLKGKTITSNYLKITFITGLERLCGKAFRGVERKITSVTCSPWVTMKTGLATPGEGSQMATRLAARPQCSGVCPCSVACLLRAGQKQRACIAASPCFVWCRHQESNPGPTDYKSVALPSELYRQVRALIIAIRSPE